MHKLYMHHSVALLGGRANRSAKFESRSAQKKICQTDLKIWSN